MGTPMLLDHRTSDRHNDVRRFIGPMPVAALEEVETTLRKSGLRKTWAELLGLKPNSHVEEDEEEGFRDALKDLTLRFFLGHGGKREDWGEVQERAVREKMLKQWRESEWGRALRRRKEIKSSGEWVGSSFDIGVFLGVNILESSSSQNENTRPCGADSPVAATTRSTAAETFLTAPERPDIRSTTHGQTQSSWSIHPQSQTTDILYRPATDDRSSANSSTALLGPSQPRDTGAQLHVRSEHPPSSYLGVHSPRRPSMLARGQPSSGKGKGKTVHYPDTIAQDAPASPSDVLARQGSDVEDTSAGAAQDASVENRVRWGDTVMRDRMLIKISYTKTGAISPDFDEWQNRVTSHLRVESFGEYIVAWRKDKLEIYDDFSTPGREWLSGSGHKKLIFLVPLSAPSTRLSVYSFADMTFCITCPPMPLSALTNDRWHARDSNERTQIVIFKVKSRSRAVDWVWNLWRHLGGQLPSALEIWSPTLDTRVEINIPNHDTPSATAAYAVFNKDNLIKLCGKSLRSMQEYKSLIEDRLAEGATFELAWRHGTILDWVWQLDDVQGQSREWAVLSGLALKQGGTLPHLEIRLRQHTQNRLRLKDGTRLDEPPGVEGYLDRIRVTSQTKQAVYLVTHNGYIFVLSPARSNRPPPPGPPPEGYVAEADGLRKAEVRRGTRQILEATGMSDLRSVVAVRRAFQVVPMRDAAQTGTEAMREEAEIEQLWAEVDRSDLDDNDPGGDAGLAMAQDKAKLRMRRSFELVLTTGAVVRFEAYSCMVALEWIMRLRALVWYWRHRHQADAQQEMDVVHLSTGRPRVTPLRRVDSHIGVHEPPPDPKASLPELTTFFNWCTLEDCRPILKSGRLFARQGVYGQYWHTQLVLVSGSLVKFRVTDRASLYHRRHKTISLLDAYVCSGYFAAQYLPEGQYDPNAPPVARRYQDGLETDDSEEDTLFIVWYRPTIKGVDSQGSQAGQRSQGNSAAVPPLSAKRKVEIFRTRSKLERDVWVWAINSEIEKIVRATQEREDRMREAGGLVDTKRKS
ncbi:hypothetical protein CERSUDRAFT_112180 [Gelatoporia subvermispora B]|uniref:Uncharacterized protein n=1 Tax=Ceriporiopsis subvermispora (strain B) TaxID=914234 RepID=M2R5V3_CERS8|nr:hypothetical protein CERSUDRAFT_112180 [Gelatoporia subvermispora B]